MLWMLSVMVMILGTCIVSFTIIIERGKGEYGLLFPFWYPWLYALAALVIGLGAGRAMWRGDSAVRLVALCLVVSGFTFIAVNGYYVLWLSVPEIVLFLALTGYERRTRARHVTTARDRGHS